MNGKDLARDVANVAWDVLQTLTRSMKFWRMNELTSGTAVPPIDLGADWSAAAQALPSGTQQRRPPDWAYRREILEDRRDDLDRLAGLLPPPLRPAADGIGVMAQSVAARVRWQATHAPGRRWIPRSNMGVVTFHGPVDAPVVRHSLYTFDLSDPLSPGRPYVVVDAPLAARPGEIAPAVPTQGATP